MSKKKIYWVFGIAFSAILVIALSASLAFISISGRAIDSPEVQGNSQNQYSIPSVSEARAQLVANQKKAWDHMPISYSINREACGGYESRQIERAFNEISSVTNGVVSFVEVEIDADISLDCSFVENCYSLSVDINGNSATRTESICGYERGKATVSSSGNVINSAKIELYGLAGFAETDGKGMSGFAVGRCGWPQTEVHEILHAFGYRHNDNPNSIMYHKAENVGYSINKLGACSNSIRSIDEYIIEDLIVTYG